MLRSFCVIVDRLLIAARHITNTIVHTIYGMHGDFKVLSIEKKRVVKNRLDCQEWANKRETSTDTIRQSHPKKMRLAMSDFMKHTFSR